MRVYTVHVHRSGLDPDRDIQFVREGFNWPAFLFVVLWALVSRLWLVAAALLALEVAVGLASTWLGLAPPARGVISLAVAVLVGMFANDTRRWTLGRRGFACVGVVGGADEDAAAQRFFDRTPELTAEFRP